MVNISQSFRKLCQRMRRWVYNMAEPDRSHRLISTAEEPAADGWYCPLGLPGHQRGIMVLDLRPQLERLRAFE